MASGKLRKGLRRRREWTCKRDSAQPVGGRWELAWGKRTYVMGIINATPDSFSGDGLEYNVESAVEQGLQFQAEGADIVDVGGSPPGPARRQWTPRRRCAGFCL